MDDFWSDPQVALALDADDVLGAFAAFDMPAVASGLIQPGNADTNYLTDFDCGECDDTHLDDPGLPPASELDLRLQEPRRPAPTAKTLMTSNNAVRNQAAAKRPRNNSRIEILDLRDEVQALQAQLAKVKRAKESGSSESQAAGQRLSHAPPRPAAGTASSEVLAQLARRNAPKPRKANAAPAAAAAPLCVWLDVAVEQYAHLQRSEALNRRLRAAVKKQMKMSELVQSLLRRNSPQQDLFPSPAMLAPPRPLSTAELYAGVELLFARAPIVSRAIQLSSDSAAAFNSCRSKHDAVAGPSLEITTSTPLACDFKQLGQLVWTNTRQMCEAMASVSSTRKANAHERPMAATFLSPYGDVLVKGAGVIRLFEDANHIVIASAIKYSVSGTDLVLREHSWVIITDVFGASDAEFADWDATPMAHFQTFYRLFAEQFNPGSATGSTPFARAPDERTQRIQEIVTKGMGDRMRDYALLMQTMLVAEMETAGTRKLEFCIPSLDCPYS